MTSDDFIVQDNSYHFRILGICWVVYGVICLVTALWLVSFSNTATMMFGSLLGRVPNPFTMMGEFHFVYGVVVAFSALCGVLGFLAGLALLAGQAIGRTVALLTAFLCLSSIPLGTTLGIYTLIVLLPLGAPQLPAVTTDTRSASLRGQPVTM